MERVLALACLPVSATALRPTLAALRKPTDRGHRTRLCSSLLPGWSEVADENGQTFFFNEATGESQWEALLAQQDKYDGTSAMSATAKWSIDGFSGVASFSGVAGVTIGNEFQKFQGANRAGGALQILVGNSRENMVDNHRLEHGREGNPCQLPYLVGAGEARVRSRYNMVEQKETVSRGQCKVRCTADGAAILASYAECGPALWRTAGGPWNVLYKDQEQVLSEGDQISLGCNDPEGAVFVMSEGGVSGEQQQPTDLTGGQQAAGWVAQIDEASGQTFHFNRETGESQWELPE